MSEAADTDVAGAIDDGTTEGTPLPRAFLVEASGPATIIREHSDIVERTNGEVEITHRIETLEEFGEFWALRNMQFPKRETIDKLLGEQEGDSVHYNENADDWDVQIDGHVQAFFGVAETIVDGVDLETFDAPTRRFHNRVRNNIGKDADELVADFAKDLKSSDIWGPGAQLAEVAVKHANREGIGSYVETLFKEVDPDSPSMTGSNSIRGP